MSEGYGALREHAAWLDLSSRGRIRVTGEDRVRLLHAMTTNHVQQLTPGTGCYAFFLNPQGRILGDANIFCFEDHFLLDTEAEAHEKLFEHLDRYIIADDVTIEDVRASAGGLATIAVEGPEAAAALLKIGAPIPEHPFDTVQWKSRIVARVNSTGSEGFSIFVPVDQKADLISQVTAHGVPAASAEDARIVRIENGRPRYGEEIIERYLVQETGQMHAIHFTKGCYLGQEIVERVRSRGQVHRVLRRLEIDAAEAPAAGAKLKAGDADAGEISSAVCSPALGKVVALAYVRVPHTEPGTELVLDGAKVRVS